MLSGRSAVPWAEEILVGSDLSMSSEIRHKTTSRVSEGGRDRGRGKESGLQEGANTGGAEGKREHGSYSRRRARLGGQGQTLPTLYPTRARGSSRSLPHVLELPPTLTPQHLVRFAPAQPSEP